MLVDILTDFYINIFWSKLISLDESTPASNMLILLCDPYVHQLDESSNNILLGKIKREHFFNLNKFTLPLY